MTAETPDVAPPDAGDPTDIPTAYRPTARPPPSANMVAPNPRGAPHLPAPRRRPRSDIGRDRDGRPARRGPLRPHFVARRRTGTVGDPRGRRRRRAIGRAGRGGAEWQSRSDPVRRRRTRAHQATESSARNVYRR